MKKRTVIRSSKQALEESFNIPRIWSEESRLSQRILIYAVELLEDIRRNIIRPPRKKSEWQKLVAKTLKGGGTMRQAAEKWGRR